MRFVFLLLFISCVKETPEPQMTSKILYDIISQPATVTDWWLGGGTIPESTNYTVYDPAIAASLSDSYVNLANPGTRNASPVVAPTLTSGIGWQFNGSTTALNTSINVTDGSTTLVLFQNSAINDGYIFGVLSTNRWAVRSYVSGTGSRVEMGTTSSAITGSGLLTSGFLAINKERVFQNQNVLTPSTITWSGSSPIGIGLHIGAYNAGTLSTFYSGIVSRFAHYNFILSEAQIDAVFEAMIDIGEDSLHSYSSSVLALNPLAYYPLNNKTGYTFIKNHAPTNAGAYIVTKAWSAGTAGQYGNCFFSDTTSPFYTTGTQIQCTGSALTNLDLNEWSWCGWFKIQTSAINQKLIEMWRVSRTEYSAWETRGNNKLTIYERENGVLQIIENLVTFPDDTWVHIVGFNSLSQGKIGYYVNGVKYEVSKTGSGFSGTVSDLMEIGVLDGYVQHFAIFDHALSQSEVNSLQ